MKIGDLISVRADNGDLLTAKIVEFQAPSVAGRMPDIVTDKLDYNGEPLIVQTNWVNGVLRVEGSW